MSAAPDHLLVKRFSNALPRSLFDAVRSNAMKLTERGPHTCTWWHDANSRHQSTLGATVASLRSLVKELDQTIGVEWWIRIKPAHQGMALHFDKDETLAADQGRIEHPAFASVLYLSGSGGPTIVVDAPVVTGIQTNAAAGFLSSAEANTFLVFSGHLQHGVMQDSREISQNEPRATLLLNWWLRKPLAPGCRDSDGFSWDEFGEQLGRDTQATETPLRRFSS